MLNGIKRDGKLWLWAYQDDNFSRPADGCEDPFVVSINPESYKRSFVPKRSKDREKDAAGNVVDAKVIDPPPEQFELELIFDGTGAIPGTSEVNYEINEFKRYALEYNGDIHSTNFLKLQWGGSSDLTFKGQLKEFSVSYSLFDRNGKPLRAKGTAKFIEFIDPKTRESLKKKNSPDLTHVRYVQDGDNLPLMCFRIYGRADFYVQVAQANGLSTVMELEAGQRIVFPPIHN